MRIVKIDITEADHKRLALAFKHEAFGLEDPVADLREKGFTFSTYTDKTVQMSYRGHIVARSKGRGWRPDDLLISDEIPEAMNAAIVRVFTRIRDTAKTIDSIIKADARAVKARVKDVEDQAPQAGRIPFSRDALIRIAATAEARGGDVKIDLPRGETGEDDLTFSVRIISQAVPDNTRYFRDAFTSNDEGIMKDEFMPKVEFLAEMSLEADRIYADAVSKLNVQPRADAAAFSARDIKHWHKISDGINKTYGDLSIVGGYRDVVVSLGNVRMMKCTYTQRGDNFNFNVICDGSMPAGIRNGLLHKVRQVVLAAESRFTPALDMTREEALGIHAAEALADIETGYTF